MSVTMTRDMAIMRRRCMTARVLRGVARRLGRRKFLDGAVQNDATDRAERFARRGHGWIAPGEKHFAAALCYNEIARRLRDHRNRRVRIAAFSAGSKNDKQRDAEFLHGANSNNDEG